MTRIVDDDDAEIEAEIQKELDALSAESLQVEDLEDELSSLEINNKDDHLLPESIAEYLRSVQSRTENIQHEVNECDIVLQDIETDQQKNEDQIIANKIKEVLGDDCHDNPLEIRNKVLTEIEESEGQEEKEKLQKASHENTMAIDIVRTNVSDAIQLLEETAAKQLQDLEEKQNRKMQERMEMYEKMKREENERVEQEQRERKIRQKELEEAQKRLNENQKMAQEKIEHEKKEEEQELSLLEKKFQKEIKELEEENIKEKKAFEQIKLQEAEYQRNKQNKAALTIQKTYRGHRVYKQHKDILNVKKQERIRQQEADQEKKYREEIEKKEEEKKMKELEEKRRVENERIRKEEKWKKEMEEKKRKEDELKREEEEKKKEEEEKRRREEEDRKRQEEEKKKREEEARKKIEDEKKRREEEEQRRIEEEEIKKREDEKKRREEEEKRKEEEERKKEEERMRKVQEEKKLKEVEQRKVEENNKKEEERRLQEEKRKEKQIKKLEEIERQKEQEEQQKQEQEKARMEEEKKKEEFKKEIKRRENDEQEMKRRDVDAIDIKKTGNGKEEKHQEDTTQFTPDEVKSLEERRQKWLKEHTPWSTTTSEERNQPVAKPRNRPRRPFSASKSLPTITKEQILQASPLGTSLHKVVRVSLSSCPACNMNGLDCCRGIKSLTMIDCGLLAVEGLNECKELQEIRLQNNKIEYLNIKDLSQLQELTLTSNHLTSVQGLVGCNQLRHLDLNNNKITRIGDLSSCPNLQNLCLDNNQLIMTKGLCHLPCLQSLSCTNNHLPNVKEIESCQLLQRLDITGNNLQKPPLLNSHVLLQELILDDNSISTLEPLADVWLPSLRVLSVSQNSISNVVSLSGLVMLHTLNISNNLISDLDGIVPGVCGCKHLSILKIIGNPVNEEPQCRDTIISKLPQLTQLDEDTLQSKVEDIVINTSSPIVRMCSKQLREYDDLVLRHRNELSLIDENTSDPVKVIKRLNLKSQHFDEVHQQAVRHLLQHEEEFDGNHSEPVQEVRKNDKDEKAPKKVEAQEKYPSKQSDIVKINVHEETGKKHKMTQKEAATKIQALWRGWHIRHLIDVQMKRWLAAVTIQAAWRGYQVRSRARRKPSVSRACKALWGIRHDAAATTIQACYRGYRVRRILAQAMQTVKYNSDDDDEFNYDEEVDLSAFDIDNGLLDEGWTPTDIPQLPSRGPALPRTGQGIIQSKPKSHQPRQAWRSADSPMEPHQPANQHQVPGLNLQRSPENDLMSVTSGGQSHLTHRAEEMGVEWGLKNATTAELMWKRANRMKYNPARKRKMLDPTKRLALFKKLDEANKLKDVKPPPKRQPQRIDYFAARELPSGANTPVSERQAKAQMTYSWVHSQGVVHQDQESNYMDFTPDFTTPTKQKKNIMRAASLPSKSPVILPQLDPVQLAGRNVPLVSSPALIREQMSKEATPRRHSSISEARSAASGNTGRANEKSNSAGARITNERRDLR